jgi:branched-chain amino acid aminotransferase
MLVCLNGKWVPEEAATVSIFDRGFLYGDALFETMRVANGGIFRWDAHLERLEQSCTTLQVSLPWSPATLCRYAQELIHKNEIKEGILRLTVSRGRGPRGYSPAGADDPLFILNLHALPALATGGVPSWRLITSKWRLPAGEGIHSLKTANRLLQVMARNEAAQAAADEALLLNVQGVLAEGASSNIFWIEGETVFTPPRATGLLPGITRGVLLEICAQARIKVEESEVAVERLQSAAGIFCTLSTWGAVEVTDIDHLPCNRSPLTRRLQEAYARILELETKATTT